MRARHLCESLGDAWHVDATNRVPKAAWITEIIIAGIASDDVQSSGA
jgi:hypothetical protein